MTEHPTEHENDDVLPSEEPAEDYPGPGHDTADEVVGPEDDPDRPLGDVLADPNDPRAYPAAED
jgi:hypothetical protein